MGERRSGAEPDLSADMLRLVVINDRRGLYGRRGSGAGAA